MINRAHVVQPNIFFVGLRVGCSGHNIHHVR